MKNRTHSFPRELFDLFSSMRFAVALLSVLGIASVIGTVLRQNEPYANYAIQFGQFWFAAFEYLGLYDVYHSLWFIGMLAFVVLSTGLCVYRNTPLMLREIRAWREHVSAASLKLFTHQAEYALPLPHDAAQARLARFLTAHGYRYRICERPEGALIVAKAGAYQRLGYILTHVGLIVICVGGLIDGNLPFKLQEMLGHKQVETRDILASAVPPQSRLPASNLSFRANMTVAEGSRGEVAFLRMRDGYLVQELPFSIALEKFRIEHYPTGQPKSFESDVAIIDPARAEPFRATIRVNHPLVYNGIAIYQSDFQDGGSSLAFEAWPLKGPVASPHRLQGKVGSRLALEEAGLTLELDDFRLFNVLDLSQDGKGAPRNVGPSVTYRLRDAQGQAHEYLSYMQPLQLDGRSYLVSGMRAKPGEEFAYLRLPLDTDGSIAGFMQWRAIMMDPAQAPLVARRLGERMLAGNSSPEAHDRFEQSVSRLLALFAEGGFNSLAAFIEKSVPESEREQAAESYLRLLEGCALEAYAMVRQPASAAPVAADPVIVAFARDSLTALSDAFYYGAPFYLQLSHFEQRQASGFQLTRAPGKNLVYGGSVLLVLGIFAMFYLRERRIWLLLDRSAGRLLFAMSGARKSRDFEAEFERHQRRLRQLMENPSEG